MWNRLEGTRPAGRLRPQSARGDSRSALDAHAAVAVRRVQGRGRRVGSQGASAGRSGASRRFRGEDAREPAGRARVPAAVPTTSSMPLEVQVERESIWINGSADRQRRVSCAARSDGPAVAMRCCARAGHATLTRSFVDSSASRMCAKEQGSDRSGAARSCARAQRSDRLASARGLARTPA